MRREYRKPPAAGKSFCLHMAGTIPFLKTEENIQLMWFMLRKSEEIAKEQGCSWVKTYAISPLTQVF